MASLAEIAGVGEFVRPVEPNNVDNAERVANESISILKTQAEAQKMKGPAFSSLKYTTDKDGKTKVSVEMPEETYRDLSELVQTGRDARGAFAQAAAQLSQKRQLLQENPVLAGVGRIAATAAASYSGNRQVEGLVRGAGAYGLDTFGKTPDELAVEEAKLKAQEFQVLAAQQDAEGQVKARAFQEASGLQQVAIQKAQLDIQQSQAKSNELDRALNPYMAAAQSGNVDAANAMLSDPVVKEAYGDDEAGALKMQAQSKSLHAIAAGAKAKIAEDRKFQVDLVDHRLRGEAGIALARIRADKMDRQTMARQSAISAIDMRLAGLSGEKSKAQSTISLYAAKAGLNPATATNEQIIQGLTDVFAQKPEMLPDVIKELSSAREAMTDSGALEVSLKAQRQAYVKSLPKEEQAILADLPTDALGSFLYLRLGRKATDQEYEEARKSAAAEFMAANEQQKKAMAEQMIGKPGFFDKYEALGKKFQNDRITEFFEVLIEGKKEREESQRRKK